VSHQDQAVYFNAVPLFVLAGAYLLVAAALAPTLWRERSRISVTDVALALIFPGIGIPAAIFGAVVLYDRSPVSGHVWPPFVATVIALVPALIFLRRWSDPAGVVMSGPRAREAEQLVSVRDRELASVATLANSLSRSQDSVEAARVLLDEVASLLGLELERVGQRDSVRAQARELAGSLLVEVGAGIDLAAGRFRVAPRWMTRIGAEWLFRLVQEPRRLARRYLIEDPWIILWALRTRLSGR